MRFAALVLLAALLAGCSPRRGRTDQQEDARPAPPAPDNGTDPDPPAPPPAPPPVSAPERERPPTDRWIVRFRTASGADYVAQLAACEAGVYVQDDDGRWWVYRDLRTPRPEPGDAAVATAPTTYHAHQKPKEIAEALKHPGTPKQVKVVFPNWLFVEFARKELAYRNRAAKDIKETIFLVTPGKDGKPVVTVVDQAYLR